MTDPAHLWHPTDVRASSGSSKVPSGTIKNHQRIDWWRLDDCYCLLPHPVRSNNGRQNGPNENGRTGNDVIAKKNDVIKKKSLPVFFFCFFRTYRPWEAVWRNRRARRMTRTLPSGNFRFDGNLVRTLRPWEAVWRNRRARRMTRTLPSGNFRFDGNLVRTLRSWEAVWRNRRARRITRTLPSGNFRFDGKLVRTLRPWEAV